MTNIDVAFHIYKLVPNKFGEWVWLRTGGAKDACSAVELCDNIVKSNPYFNVKVFKVITEEVYSLGNWKGDTVKQFKKVESMGKPMPKELKQLMEKYLRDDNSDPML